MAVNEQAYRRIAKELLVDPYGSHRSWDLTKLTGIGVLHLTPYPEHDA